MRKKKLAIIGNGMGTCRLLDELVARDGTFQYEVTVFGEERGGAYNRILLGRVLGGDAPSAIVTKPPEWYDRHGVRLTDRTEVTRLDTQRKNVETAAGQSSHYDVAVLATGSQPLVPPFEGLLDELGEMRPGIFVYRTMADCLRIREHARSGDGAVVVGGGLLGLEAAKVLSDLGLHVTVIHVSPTLMNAQLDDVGGEMLSRQIERSGIFVRVGRTVEALYGDPNVEGVILDDGTSLPADLVVLACGVRPRIDLAKASGLPVNKGILINDTLATEVPSVYAFGECAEHQGRLYGIVAPVWEQATVLADVLTGKNPTSRYRGSKLYTRLKVAGVEVASMGCLDVELSSDEVFQVIEERKNAYRKLVVRDGKLIGAMLVGNTAASGVLVQLFDRGDQLPDDPLEALCQTTLGSSASADRLVCNCHKVSQSEIHAAITGGASDLDTLGDATRAGTGCGSCKGELTQMLASVARKTVSLPLVAAS